jgi:hypothetical protein
MWTVPPVEPKANKYKEFRMRAALEFSKVILSLSQHRTIDGEDSIKAAVYLANKLVEELEKSQPDI